ncbi:MAG: glycosyltransferase family 4 protein [Myxococcota bacterium]|nr:glycosyltransferase family 4 protein [Myxococcota bacterium]
MRILLIGAFPFPYPQGSQVFAAGQAAALARSGVQVALASYGAGEGVLPDGIDWIPSSRRFAPSHRRSGPSLGKPLADAALVATVVGAQRRRRFDLALAHNAEAALVAASARRLTGLRYVYVAHTLLERELSAYAAQRHRARLDRLGSRIDRWVAGSADAVITLSRAAEKALTPYARGPVAHIPPGLERSEPPSESRRRDACRAHGLEPGGFFLYTGNLDGYQELDRLASAAACLAEGAPPVVVATHDARDASSFPGLRVFETDFASARALAFEAAALVLTRSRTGGFPIKLLNYMETGRPIVAFDEIAEGLTDDRTACLLLADAGPESIARALCDLADDRERAGRIGAAALAHLRTAHDWTHLADRTLGVLGGLARGSEAGGGPG